MKNSTILIVIITLLMFAGCLKILSAEFSQPEISQDEKSQEQKVSECERNLKNLSIQNVASDGTAWTVMVLFDCGNYTEMHQYDGYTR